MSITNQTKILFHGDSITDAGRDRNDLHSIATNGYTGFAVDRYYNAHDTRPEFFNRAISGYRTTELLTVMQNDLDSIKPDIVSLHIGINDVWRKFDSNIPTTDQQFAENFRKLLDMIVNKGAKIIVLGPYLLPDPAKAHWADEFEAKRSIVEKISYHYDCQYVDMHKIFSTLVEFGAPWERFSHDAVHPTVRGCEILADAYLKCLEQL